MGGREAKRLFAHGQPAHGRITGIRVRDIGSSDDPIFVKEYAVEVEGDTTFTCGVRHSFAPEGLVRLGMEVAVLFEGTDAVIDWRATCGGEVKSSVLLSEAPEPGIHDGRLHALKRARKRFKPARATIVGIERREGIFGRSAHWELEVTRNGAEPRQVTVHQGPPHYATHLGHVGTELPAWVARWGRKRVMVDWPMAAMERPGVDEPPAEVFAWLDQNLGRFMGM
jgi:hypothetical protein